LKPYEEKTFTQYFLPYRELGIVKNASKDILLSIDVVERKLVIKIQATSKQEIKLKVLNNKHLFYEEQLLLSPEQVYTKEIASDTDIDLSQIEVLLYNTAGINILSYHPEDDVREGNLPAAAKPALLPEEIDSIEQLFFTGQHLEQYRHATYRPMPYYLEGIRREPGDTRCNNAIGLWKLKKGLFEESIEFFKIAIGTITDRNPNPYNCEPYFNLGLANLYLGNVDQAYDAFFKSAWDKSFQDAAYYNVALIDFFRQDYQNSLTHINSAIDRNAGNGKAYLVKVSVLKKLGKLDLAKSVIDAALNRDLFNLSLLFERYKFDVDLGDTEAAALSKNELLKLSGGTSHNAIEYAIDYFQLGLYETGIEFLLLVSYNDTPSPLVNYYAAYGYSKLNRKENASQYYEKAASANSQYCFPNRLYDILVLNSVIGNNSADAKAYYYLGNLYYDKQQYNIAIDLWEASLQIDNKFPTTFRNLGLAYYNKRQDPANALKYYEIAYSLDPSDNRIVMELDSLYKKFNRDAYFRLNFLT
ncbi:MAG: tetratricopeptide repeat protein, partial [Flavobacterium sp.]